ncbi:MAG TPA: S8 family serine peptidase [Polyangiaceae bacterium]|nr:S8 family serine peptidase [Polyangiaceae bacterium]
MSERIIKRARTAFISLFRATVAASLGVFAAACAGPPPGDFFEGTPPSSPRAETAAPKSVPVVSAEEGAFVDRGRRVLAVREGSMLPDASGRPRPLVRLHYDDRALTATALVGDGAIVRVEGVSDADLPEYLAAEGVRPVRSLMPSIGLWLVEDMAGGDGLAVASRLAPRLALRAPGDPGIRQAIPDLHLRRRLFADPFKPNDPRYSGQWFWKDLKMEEAWGLTKGDPSTTVVVIDSGCDLGHADLVAKLDPGKDVIDDDDDPTYNPSAADNAHGTACAGLIGASTDNNEGIAGGCPECRLRCVRLVEAETMVPLSADVAAFNFALETGAAVVSNSWGFVEPIPVPQALEDAINNVFDTGRGGLGALVLFAVGNDAREIANDELPAVRGVLGIGAINSFESETPFTNSGDAVDLVVQTGTLTTDITGPGGYVDTDYSSNFGGTSSACPVAAGIAALVVSAAPSKTSEELYQVLIKTARPAPYAVPDATGHDAVFGYGIIDPVKALSEVLGPQDVPDAGPDAGPPPPPPPVGDGDDEVDEGCACSAVGSGSPGGSLSLVALALALARAVASVASKGRRGRAPGRV